MNRRARLGVLVSLVAVSGALVAPPAFGAPPANAEAAVAPTVAQTVRDAHSAATESVASQVAVRFGHPVVIDSKTTPTEQVSALPDGTYQLVENTVPVRVKTPTGWTPLDTNLTTASDGLLAPKAADTPVEFGAGGDTVLARIRTKTGKWLMESSPFGTLPRPTVDGAAATYPEVLPGVDLRVTATAQGMSEVLIIKSASAAANPLLKSVQFGVSGSALAADASGIAKATASDGSTVISTSPTWWDSSNGSTADGPAGNASAEPVTQSSAGSKISLDAQAATSSRAVQYPVFVDPDWTGGLQAYTYVDKAYLTQSYWDGQYATGQQRTGYVAASYSSDNRNHTARSLWQVDTTGVEGKHITNAVFSVTEDWSFNCTASEVDLYWSAGISPSTTWNNQPGLIQYLSNAVVAHGNNSSCPTAAVGFSATAGVQGAANVNATGLTLELRAANEASNTSWKRFTQAATLTVTYNTPPNNPSAAAYTSPSRSCSTSSASPTYLDGTQPIGLGVTATDADAGQNVNTVFYVYNSSGTQVWSGSYPTSAQGARSVTIPANTLAIGAYSWNARNGDLIDLSPGFSPTCYFSIATTAPAIPTVSQTSTGTATVGQPITVQFGSGVSDGVAVFAYWWVEGSGTTPPVPPALTPIVPGGALPGCGTASGPVRFVCRDAGSLNATNVTIAPIDTTSTLWVASYNDAGRVSVNAGGTYAAAALHVTAAADTTGVSNAVGHIWDSQTITSSATSVPDLNTTSGTSGPTVRQALGSPLDLIDGDFEGIPTTLLNYTTASSGSMTASGEAIDTKNSFTVSAWLYPSATSSTTVSHVAISEIGTGGAAFSLGTGVNGVATFCRTSQVNQSQACAVGASIQYGDWTLVTGIWDSANQSLRVLVNDGIATPAGVASQPVPANDTSASSWLCVGGSCAISNGSFVTTSPWDGQVFRPAVFPGVISGNQLNNLYNVLSPNDDPPADESIGAVVNASCGDLVTPQNMYDYNPNFSSITWTPDPGSDAARAISWNGVACRWVNDTSNDTIDISVANIVDRGTMVQLQDAAASGTSAPGYGDSAYFKMTGDVGELQIFSGSYWITLKSDYFWAASDADPLPVDILAHLP